MRLIHTADWHLGRIFHGVHLTEDQGCVLDQLVAVVKESKVDAVLVAGDVYDRAVPPSEAVRLLDDVLSRLVLGCKVPVVVIAGNHDSPERLGFGSRLMAGEGLHVVGSLTAEPAEIVLQDEHGPVHIYALPYAELALVRERFGREDVRDHQAAAQAMVDAVSARRPSDARSILMGHAFVVGGEASESERPLSVGGAGTVDAAVLAGFNYVALGHLHRPQSVADKQGIQYSGSLLKYSFSEAEHTKSVTLIDMDAKGGCQVERIALPPRRDLRTIEGLLDDLLKGPQNDESPDDYLLVTLLDRQPILDAVGKLRAVYPNVLQIERPHFAAAGGPRAAAEDYRRMGDAELFEAFFKEVTGEPLDQSQREAYVTIVDEMLRQQREVAR